MKVKQLIDLLGKESPDADVYVTYDSFFAGYLLENIIAVYDNDESLCTGIHLLAMDKETMFYRLGIGEEKTTVVGEFIQGRIIHQQETKE